MAKGICPTCDQLVGISPTGEPQQVNSGWIPVGTSTWWRVDMHKAPGQPAICDGSGKKV